MLRIGKEAVGAMRIGKERVEALFVIAGGKAVKIWEGVRSCFGSGAWLEEKPWIDDDAWKE